MFAEVYCPETLDPEQLDQYLEQGWFRMGQTIFSTNFLNFKNQFYSAIWLRLSMDELHDDSTKQKLTKRNAAFKIEIRKASLTSEKETLFAAYRQSISFEASASLKALLFGKASHSVYDTQEINIYDGDKLIALGFFDLGKKSAAGILSFYDPAYKKYSLGKYLIYLKMDYCKKLKLKYFYPGYFVPGYSLFDYKLEIGKPAIQYLSLFSKQWMPLVNFSKDQIPLQAMNDKLHALQHLLTESKIESKLLRYEFFDANLIPELNGIELFDFPVFVFCPILNEKNLTVLIYDVRDRRYHWLKCRSVWTSTGANDQSEIYSSHVLRFEEDLFSSALPEEMVSILEEEISTEGKIQAKHA